MYQDYIILFISLTDQGIKLKQVIHFKHKLKPLLLERMTVEAIAPNPETSSLQGHFFSTDISDNKYNFRVLKMQDSLFIYIGPNEAEVFTEMAMAMPMPDNGECLATTIMGEQLCCSQELAVNIAKKLKKQVYLSCNVPQEPHIRPALCKRFADEVKQSPDYF